MKLSTNPILPGETEDLLRLLRDIAQKVNGQVDLYGPVSLNLSSASGNYTISPDDYTIEYTTGTYTVTLPSAVTVGFGKIYNIKNSGTGLITVEGNGSETIDGDLNVLLNQYDNLQVQSNGTNWIIL